MDEKEARKARRTHGRIIGLQIKIDAGFRDKSLTKTEQIKNLLECYGKIDELQGLPKFEKSKYVKEIESLLSL